MPQSQAPRVRSRRLAAGLVLGPLLGAALALSGPAALPARATERPITLNVSAIRSGSASNPRVVVLGRVSRNGRAMRDERVDLQVRTTGTTTWRTIETSRTDRAGRVRLFHHVIRRGKQFRLVHVERAVRSISRAVVVPVANSISIDATTNPTPEAGDQVQLQGTTTPGLIGTRIYLQLLVADAWRSVSSSVVRADGTFAVRAVATIGGDRSYRAVVEDGPGHEWTSSAVRELTVYAWYRLARTAQQPQTDTAPLAAGREVVAGQPYIDGLGRTLQQGERAVSAFDLGNRCLSFRSVVGPTSDSDAGFYGVFRARADDDTLLDVQLDRGSSQEVDADITGASTLTLVSAAAAGAGDAGWGDPEVLCAGL